jgi:hypothetical protein
VLFDDVWSTLQELRQAEIARDGELSATRDYLERLKSLEEASMTKMIEGTKLTQDTEFGHGRIVVELERLKVAGLSR